MGMRDADELRKLFDIPESETIMAVIALGYRDGEPNRPERRPLDEIAKFF
jgi:nitroreductase